MCATFADNTDPYSAAGGMGGASEDSYSAVQYFKLPPHPDAQNIPRDTTRKWADLSVEERAYFTDNIEHLAYAAFFKCVPSYNYSEYAPIVHNIRAYTLYRLVVDEIIKLYSFDSTAALMALKISADGAEVLVPNSGKFVIEWGDFLIVAELEKSFSGTYEWQWFTENIGVFTAFMKFFDEMSKKYNQYNEAAFDAQGNFIELPDVTLDNIYLDSHIREEIKNNIIDYTDPEKIALKKRNGLPTKRGVIFTGAPGTGKTFLSRVLAKTLKTAFLVVTGLEERGASQIRSIFKFARKFERIVVLFEDIDLYAGGRRAGDAVAGILNELDGIEVRDHFIVICTTNCLEALDDALKDRPGRFDRVLYFKSPKTALKIEMLKGFCKDLSIENVDFKEVVSKIPSDYTGAHLKELYITAVSLAVDRGHVDSNGLAVLETSFFFDALKILKSSGEENRQIGFNDLQE